MNYIDATSDKCNIMRSGKHFQLCAKKKKKRFNFDFIEIYKKTKKKKIFFSNELNFQDGKTKNSNFDFV